MENKTEQQKWIQRRVDAVKTAYTAYDSMVENGYGDNLIGKDTAIQVSCPFHGTDSRPSARYYPISGHKSDYVRCYFCKENWDSLNLYMKFKNMNFMNVLHVLERRFNIKIPLRPEDTTIKEPEDRSSSNFVSEAWSDVPRVLELLEKKLMRLRNSAPLIDFIKFCRVLDRVSWDYDLAKGNQTDDMVSILLKLKNVMDNVQTMDMN